MSNELIHQRLPPLGRAAQCVGAALVALLGCGGSHLRLVTPDTTAGPRYSCDAGEGQVCQPASEDVPEESNLRGTAFVILPRECRGRIHQIVVIDADSDAPKVVATCAPDEQPVEEMSDSEPSAPPTAQRSEPAQ